MKYVSDKVRNEIKNSLLLAGTGVMLVYGIWIGSTLKQIETKAYGLSYQVKVNSSRLDKIENYFESYLEYNVIRERGLLRKIPITLP